jgi:DNA ligase D-like protein (predicted 3'-phosphoesterase)
MAGRHGHRRTALSSTQSPCSAAAARLSIGCARLNRCEVVEFNRTRKDNALESYQKLYGTGAGMAENTLKPDQEQRHFKKASEPQGRKGKNKSIFVIQKHEATTLHYDFRLSIDGVLKSWAVPKGLSTRAGEKRLAIRTEDHPMEYADFEGLIPEGAYGGGTVMVWDTGEVEPIAQSEGHELSMAGALEKGAIKFNLKGKKLKGRYALVRMDKKAKQEQWLIFKLRDEHADARRNPIRTEPDSVLTGRSMKDIAKEANQASSS